MNALQALDQLRQRTAWALSQILVSSSTINFIETEQYLHFYDIFVRNTFGSYLQVMPKVTFSPVISHWLIRVDFSPVEYNARSPSKTSPVKSQSILTAALCWSVDKPFERTVRKTS